jgi:hypothetical protein
MSYDFEKLLGEHFNANAPAATEDIAATERSLQKSLPVDFCEFLQVSNGGEGAIGESYLMLWTVEELGEYNEAYQVDEYAPGLLLFGSDGGGEGYAFDMRTSSPSIVMIPFVGMSLKYAKMVAPTFVAFLKKLRS